METLVDAVRSELDHDDPESDLDAVLKRLDKKANSETVFDAYRRACLSRSRDLGPRIIALITAVLVGEEWGPTDQEEMILDVAERLNDGELDEVVRIIRSWEREGRDGASKCGNTHKALVRYA